MIVISMALQTFAGDLGHQDIWFDLALHAEHGEHFDTDAHDHDLSFMSNGNAVDGYSRGAGSLTLAYYLPGATVACEPLLPPPKTA